MTDEEIRSAIQTRLSVPLWPHAGQALGLKRGATYDAARAGKIPTLDVSRNKDVPTEWLQRKLQLKEPAA
jgi:hypothetical protein